MSATLPPDGENLHQLAQARYERQLLAEITKLQAALAEERNSSAAAQQEFEAEQTAAREKKMSEADKASRLLAMEKAIEAAQRDEQREFLKKVRGAE